MMHQFSWCKQCFIQTFSPQLQWLQETKSFQLGFGDKHCMQQQRMQKLGSKNDNFLYSSFCQLATSFPARYLSLDKKFVLLSAPPEFTLKLRPCTVESNLWEGWNCQPGCTFLETLWLWLFKILGNVKLSTKLHTAHFHPPVLTIESSYIGGCEKLDSKTDAHMTHIKQTHGFDALRVIHKKIPRTLKNKWKFKYSAKIKTFNDEEM